MNEKGIEKTMFAILKFTMKKKVTAECRLARWGGIVIGVGCEISLSLLE